MKNLFLLAFLLTCYLINPEIIILDNGKIIDGKIIKMDEDTMTVITKNKELIIDRDAIIQTFRSMEDYNKFKKSTKNNNKITEKGNLIAEWLFNGNADDTSGNELHGKVFGSKKMVEDRFGNKDSAYEFAIGKTKVIRVDNNISILQQQIFSISLWINIKKLFHGARIIDFNFQKMGYYIFCSLKGKINEGKFGEVAWFNNGTRKIISTEVYLNKDVWYHIVIINDNKKIKIYLNGKLENEDIRNNANIVHTKLNETNFYIGGSGSYNFNKSGDQFSGCIDDIRFYDYALSEEQIKKLYHENGWSK